MTNTELLKRSVNYRSYRSNIITYSVIMGIFYAIVLALTLSVELTEIAVTYSVIYFFMMAPFIVYNVIKMHALLKKIDSYREYTATAVEILPAMKRPVAFVLNVDNGGSAPFSITTERVFSLSALSSTYYGNFYKQKLRILYDAESGRLAVIEYLS